MGIETSALFLVAVLAAFAATFVRDPARAALWTVGSLLSLAAALAVLDAPIAALGVAVLALGPVAAPILARPRAPEGLPAEPPGGKARRARRLEMAAAGAWIVAVTVAASVAMRFAAPFAMPGPAAKGEPGDRPGVERPAVAGSGGASAAAGALFGKDVLALAAAAGLMAMAVVAASPGTARGEETDGPESPPRKEAS